MSRWEQAKCHIIGIGKVDTEVVGQQELDQEEQGHEVHIAGRMVVQLMVQKLVNLGGSLVDMM